MDNSAFTYKCLIPKGEIVDIPIIFVISEIYFIQIVSSYQEYFIVNSVNQAFQLLPNPTVATKSYE